MTNTIFRVWSNEQCMWPVSGRRKRRKEKRQEVGRREK
jgi:hypothetical protein